MKSKFFKVDKDDLIITIPNYIELIPRSEYDLVLHQPVELTTLGKPLNVFIQWYNEKIQIIGITSNQLEKVTKLKYQYKEFTKCIIN